MFSLKPSDLRARKKKTRSTVAADEAVCIVLFLKNNKSNANCKRCVFPPTKLNFDGQFQRWTAAAAIDCQSLRLALAAESHRLQLAKEQLAGHSLREKRRVRDCEHAVDVDAVSTA